MNMIGKVSLNAIIEVSFDFFVISNKRKKTKKITDILVVYKIFVNRFTQDKS